MVIRLAVIGAAAVVSFVSMPLGPLIAGALLEASSARLTVGVFAAFALVLALLGTFSSALRSV